MKRWLLSVGMGTLTLLGCVMLPSTASAQMQTLARCETDRTTVRIYDAGNGLMMRAYDRINNSEWLDTPARLNPNLEGTDYFNLRGEVAVRMYAPNRADQPCFVVIGNNPAQVGRLIGEDPIVEVPGGEPGRPIAICEGSSNRVRVFNFRNVQMMRAETLPSGSIWMETATRSVPSTFGMEYINNQGDRTVRLFVPSNVNTPCTITVNNGRPEQGRLVMEPMPR